MKRLTKIALALSIGAVVSAPGAVAQNALSAEIDRRAAELESKVIEWRREIHQNPELGNREFKTSKMVAKHLKRLKMDVTTEVAHTGVVGVLVGGKPGPVVLLRADMDALPVVEQTGSPFASTVRTTYNDQDVGVMHACGHDTHVAIMMGVAEMFAAMRDDLPGTIKFVFQPAEEGAPEGEEGGADMMIAEGLMENPAPEVAFGLHSSQGWAVGQAGYRALGAMASSDGLRIRVVGRQTHGAQPWAGIDPVVTASQIVVALQGIVSRQIDTTLAPAIVTVATIHGGVRGNIIPDDVVMTGTIRAFDTAMRDDIHARIKRIAENVATANGATAEVTIRNGTPVVFNDPKLSELMRPTFERVLGKDNVQESPMVTGAEDFAYYAEKVPSLFYFIGVRSKDVPREKAIPNHSPFFNADEAALVYGMRTMANLAVDYMEMKQEK